MHLVAFTQKEHEGISEQEEQKPLEEKYPSWQTPQWVSLAHDRQPSRLVLQLLHWLPDRKKPSMQSRQVEFEEHSWQPLRKLSQRRQV